jgi:Ser/Thr protein kinase RdoA (MazF antagonist)
MSELPLSGGRVTPGVVLVEETVRRPLGARSPFVHALLAHLEVAGFEAAPRVLGVDEKGREILSYIPGTVPPDLEPDHRDSTLAAAARLIRRFHDATAGSALAGAEEVVCHNDLSPCNFVFCDGRPMGLIDFDAAAPGPRRGDLGYALFLWLNLGTDGPGVTEQLRRARVFLDAYGLEERAGLVDAIMTVQREGIERIRDPVKPDARSWWQEQLAWVMRHREELEQGL